MESVSLEPRNLGFSKKAVRLEAPNLARGSLAHLRQYLGFLFNPPRNSMREEKQ